MKYNKEQLAELIWENPRAVTPLNWTLHGGEWHAPQYPNGTPDHKPARTVLKRRGQGLYVFCNGTFPEFPHGDIWDYLQYLNSTNEFLDVLQIVADRFGVEPNTDGYTAEQVARAQRRREERDMLKYTADFLIKALRDDRGRDTRAYLNGRGLQVSERLGAWSSDIAKELQADLMKHYNQSADVITDFVQRVFTKWNADDYKLAIPYTNGASVFGMCLRRTTDNINYTNNKGEEVEKPKYLFSKEMPKGGYCEALQGGDNTVLLVEGLLDAEALKQYGFSNVMALGGMTPTDNTEDQNKNQIQTLYRYSVKKICYLPDCEYYKDEDEAKGIGKSGERKHDATHRTIKNLLPHITGTLDGEGFVQVTIANLEFEETAAQHVKADADIFLKLLGAADMRAVIDNAKMWYEYELQQAVRKYSHDTAVLTAKAADIYRSIADYGQRNILKRDITAAKGGYLYELKAAGLNAAALTLIDRDGINTLYAARMAEVVEDMQRAHTPETMGTLLTKANRIQQSNKYDTFAAQVNATREMLHAQVRQKPPYLLTNWNLYRKVDHLPKVVRKIGFAPAAVSIVAAPTNHGKTLFLLQAAINAARDTHKKVLYLSLENDAEQLYIRALSAFIGGEAWGNTPNPRAAIREYIKAEDMPETLFRNDGKTTLDIGAEINRYWAQVAPNLHLIRCDSDIEAVTTCITEQVEQWQNDGVEAAGVFVDYLQLLHYPTLRAHSRTDEVKGICDRLNDMAKATALPVVLAAQFNRDATRSTGDKLDGVELANIGESAGIENIAEDVYLVWQVDKINPDGREYTHKDGVLTLQPNQYRSKRCFDEMKTPPMLKKGHLYIENLKARDYATGGYCLLPFNGAAGAVISTESKP